MLSIIKIQSSETKVETIDFDFARVTSIITMKNGYYENGSINYIHNIPNRGNDEFYSRSFDRSEAFAIPQIMDAIKHSRYKDLAQLRDELKDRYLLR